MQLTWTSIRTGVAPQSGRNMVLTRASSRLKPGHIRYSCGRAADGRTDFELSWELHLEPTQDASS
jgi:hypothetical protein